MKTFEIWSKLLTIKNKLSCAKKPVLSPEDLEYISSSKGSISHDQIKEQFDSFVEQHPKGKISKKEFGEMMKTCLPDFDLVNNWTGSAEVSHIFRMYDKNGDGEIDFREFMMVLYVMSNGTPEENLIQIFRIFDINTDGLLSPKEVEKVVKYLFKIFPQKEYPDEASQKVLAKNAFKEMDANSDGQVSKDEFVKACLNQESISKMLILKAIGIFVGKD